jgi:hypothetical protein
VSYWSVCGSLHPFRDTSRGVRQVGYAGTFFATCGGLDFAGFPLRQGCKTVHYNYRGCRLAATEAVRAVETLDSRQKAEGSNPSPSSGESGANPAGCRARPVGAHGARQGLVTAGVRNLHITRIAIIHWGSCLRKRESGDRCGVGLRRLTAAPENRSAGYTVW